MESVRKKTFSTTINNTNSTPTRRSSRLSATSKAQPDDSIQQESTLDDKTKNNIISPTNPILECRECRINSTTSNPIHPQCKNNRCSSCCISSQQPCNDIGTTQEINEPSIPLSNTELSTKNISSSNLPEDASPDIRIHSPETSKLSVKWGDLVEEEDEDDILISKYYLAQNSSSKQLESDQLQQTLTKPSSTTSTTAIGKDNRIFWNTGSYNDFGNTPYGFSHPETQESSSKVTPSIHDFNVHQQQEILSVDYKGKNFWDQNGNVITLCEICPGSKQMKSFQRHIHINGKLHQQAILRAKQDLTKGSSTSNTSFQISQTPLKPLYPHNPSGIEHYHNL
jgi:hypothetical protein